MSARVKLSGKLPGNSDINGLDQLADAIVDDPETTLVCAIVVFEPRKVEHDIATNTYVPTVQVRRIEAFLMDDTPAAVRDALVKAQETRTKQTPIPFESLGDADE